jgi:hypothetical protein
MAMSLEGIPLLRGATIKTLNPQPLPPSPPILMKSKTVLITGASGILHL